MADPIRRQLRDAARQQFRDAADRATAQLGDRLAPAAPQVASPITTRMQTVEVLPMPDGNVLLKMTNGLIDALLGLDPSGVAVLIEQLGGAAAPRLEVAAAGDLPR